MKRLYLLLAILIVCFQTTYGQLIWHSNLGTAPSGTVTLAWNATSHVIYTNDGDEFTSGGAWDSINEQLATAGIQWIRVNSIENPADGSYEVWFEVDTNTTGAERTVLFGTSSSYQTLIQKPQNYSPTVDWPAGRCFYICPGQSAEIQLHGTEEGKSYFVWQTYEDDNDEELDFFTGTGADYTYQLSTPGTYRFDFPDSDFEVKYYEAFDYVYDAGEEILSPDPNGGVYRYYLTKYWKNGTMYSVVEPADITFFDEPFAAFNAGKSNQWDPHMRISYGYDDSQGKLYLEISCPPNLSESTIRSYSHLRFDDNMAMEVHQTGGGKVLSLPVTYRYNGSSAKIEAVIEGSQPGVTYILYCQNIEKSRALGDGASIALQASKVPGYYHVVASYSEDGLSDTACLDSICYNAEMLALDQYSNWILTKVFNGNNSPMVNVDYYNGLGLPVQNIQIAASPEGLDLVTPIGYDIQLRDDAKSYLSYAATTCDGRKQRSAFADQQMFYEKLYGEPDAQRAFTEKLYETSPLGRVRRQALPGYMNDSVRYTAFTYRSNNLDEVRRLSVNGSGELVCEGCYDAGTLSCTETVDADGHIAQTFVDGQGQTLLTRTFDDNDLIDTYSVYDDAGRLRWVVTPEGSNLLSDSQTFAANDDFAKKYCYIYTYDERGRMIEKQLPGREAEYMVYDLGDRLIMSQDGNLRAQDQWIVYCYDDFGRLTEQRLGTVPESESGVIIGSENNPLFLYMTFTNDPTVPILRSCTYDSYPSHLQTSGLGFQTINGLTSENGASLRYENAQGAMTYEKLAVLADGAISGYHERAYYYDYKGRVIQTVERDAEEGILCTSQRYDFIGNILAQQERYSNVNRAIDDCIDRTFTYDDRSRLLSETTMVNDGQEAVVTYSYNALGQLSGKTYGTGTSAIHETIAYTIQGWQTAKSSELFDMTLGFYDTEKPSYTGNITSWQWQHKGDPSGNGPQNRYVFTYDDLSRLTNTDQYVNNEKTRQDVERCLSYDRNGNLLTMVRYENGEEQCNFSYTYDGNCLKTYLTDKIIDLELGDHEIIPIPRSIPPFIIETPLPMYEYDANGNIVEDYIRGFDLSYNQLNLLENVTSDNATVANYSYLWDGTKISAKTGEDTGLAYRGSFTYHLGSGDPAAEDFESAAFGGGRIVATEENPEVQYFLTDHLGSVRVVATDKDNVLERNDYQPFGKRWNTASMPVADNRDRFNGKEDQAFAGLPFSDYGARMYDPERGRWFTQDPKAEDYLSVSQYCFCGNNPIIFIDPNGKEITVTIDNDVLKIHYIGKVFNDSMHDYSITELQAFADMFKTQIEAAWSGTFDGLTVETTVELEVVKSVNEFEDSDHVIYIGEDLYMDKYETKDQETGHNTASGKGSVGGKYMAINNIILDNPDIASRDDGRTIAHEFGHNLGLSHPSESMINNPEYKGNIMWQRDHPKAGKSPNKTQLLYIYNNPRSYNKHSNIYPKYK